MLSKLLLLGLIAKQALPLLAVEVGRYYSLDGIFADCCSLGCCHSRQAGRFMGLYTTPAALILLC